jgi:hypothetical protein
MGLDEARGLNVDSDTLDLDLRVRVLKNPAGDFSCRIFDFIRDSLIVSGSFVRNQQVA